MAEEKNQGLFVLGVIAKAQGTRGGFLLDVSDPVAAEKQPELVYLRYPEKQWVPYRLEQMRPHITRKRNMFFVKLEGINTRTEAEQLRNYQVMTDQDPGYNTESAGVIGYKVVRDNHSQMGEVVDLLETPAYPVLVVKTDSENILIPWIDHFVSAVNDESRRITTRNTSDLESME